MRRKKEGQQRRKKEEDQLAIFIFFWSSELQTLSGLFCIFLFVLHCAGLDFICQKSQFKQSQLELWGYIIKNITLSLWHNDYLELLAT